MNELLNYYQLAVRIADDTDLLADAHEQTLARHAIPPTVTGKPGDDIDGLTRGLIDLFPQLAGDDLTREAAQHVNRAILELTRVN